jgi:hypothetical protein
MAEVGTMHYTLEYERVFKEVVSSLVERGFSLKATDVGKGTVRALWKGRGRDPDEMAEVRVIVHDHGVEVSMWARTASVLATRQVGSASVAVFFTALQGRIGDHAIKWQPPDGVPPWYPGPGPALASYGFSPTPWFPISLSLAQALLMLVFGFAGLFDPYLWTIGLCDVVLGLLLVLAAVLMRTGHLTAGGSIAVIVGILTIPLGAMAIVAGIWAFRFRDGKVPLIPHQSYMIGGSG